MYASSRSTVAPVLSRGARYHQSRMGYGNPWAPSIRARSSGRGGQIRQYLVRRADVEGDGVVRDAQRLTRGADPVLLGRIRGHRLVDRAGRGKDDGAGAGAVSIVAIPGVTVLSSHSSAGQASPQYSSPAPPWMAGGS